MNALFVASLNLKPSQLAPNRVALSGMLLRNSIWGNDQTGIWVASSVIGWVEIVKNYVGRKRVNGTVNGNCLEYLKATEWQDSSLKFGWWHYMVIGTDLMKDISETVNITGSCDATLLNSGAANGHYGDGALITRGPSSRMELIGTIVHELGHNFGLDHDGHQGGQEDKANYLSNMSYFYQTDGLWKEGGYRKTLNFPSPPFLISTFNLDDQVPDYSRELLNNIVEGNLLEDGTPFGSTATDDEVRMVVLFCPDGVTRQVVDPRSIFVDFNCNSSIDTGISQSVDLNGDGIVQNAGWSNHVDWTDIEDFGLKICNPSLTKFGAIDAAEIEYQQPSPLVIANIHIQPNCQSWGLPINQVGTIEYLVYGSDSVDVTTLSNVTLSSAVPTGATVDLDFDGDGLTDRMYTFNTVDLDPTPPPGNGDFLHFNATLTNGTSVTRTMAGINWVASLDAAGCPL